MTRQAFEAFITAPPFEMGISRFDDRGAWPGSYKSYETDLAWQSWQAATAAAMTEALAHIDALTAEVSASDIAIAEYRQQCLDNAAEIARLRAESEERLQNCAALVAEVEQLRKDAEREPMTDEDTLALFNRIQLRMLFTDADASPFASGVASAEFFHGIK